jgi:GTP cyclohydrolase I
MESIEIRKVANGYIVVVNDEDESREYIFDTHRRVVKFVKECFDASDAKQKM